MRLGIAAAVCLSIVGAAVADPAAAAIKHVTNIPAQDLGSALQTLAQEMDLQVLYLSEGVDKARTSGAIGEFTADEALTKLLQGTGLSYRYLDEKTVTVIAAGGGASAHAGDKSSVEVKHGEGATGSALGVSGNTADINAGKDAALWNRLRVAQAESDAELLPSRLQNTADSGPAKLEEVIVTAQKRNERLQDVPIAVTVLNPETLAQNGQNKLVDYFASVPGLNVTGGAFYGGTNYLTIRGLSAGLYQNPTVATVIDDVPVASSLFRSWGQLTSPDLDPSDLARIEVLKGPQGTLYGADSLSGLVKYVTVDPSTKGWSARAEVGGVDIPDGGLGYVVRGAVNTPVSDSVAFRVSGFSRLDPGYTNDITTGKSNFNSSHVYGGHVAALWHPSENLSVKLSALIQEAHGDTSLINANSLGQFTSGDLKLTSFPGTTQYMTQGQLYSATLNAKVAGLEIVSVTGYVVNAFENWKDWTASLGPYAYACAQIPYTCTLPSGDLPAGTLGVPSVNDTHTNKVSQEVRISSSVGHWLDWRLGGFYTHENSPNNFSMDYIADPTTGAITGSLYGGWAPTQTFSEWAGFGDVTVHVTDQFDVQLGGRESWYTQAEQDLGVGLGEPFFDGRTALPPYLAPSQRTEGNAFTYLVTPKLTISPNLMVYARVASGYRIGGPNVNAFDEPSAGLPLRYAPDRTTNYELGVKGSLLDRKLSFDAAAYYIAWKDFQTAVSLRNGLGYTANAGNAKSEGLELSIEARPLEGLTIEVAGSFDDAVLTQDLPPDSAGLYGVKGDRLPYSMRASGALSVNQDFHLTHAWIGFVGGAVDYVGPRPFEFASGPPPAQRIWIPGYTQFNLRTGARHDSLLINLYVNNVTDKRGIVGILQATNIDNDGGYNVTVIQPRTVGFSVSKSF